MNAKQILPSRGPCAFTARYLSDHGAAGSEALRLAGVVLAHDAGAHDRESSESHESACRRRLLLAAAEAEQLGLFLDREPALVDSDDAPELGALAATAFLQVSPLFGIAAALRLAVLAEEPSAPPQALDPLHRFRTAFATFAEVLKVWVPRLRAASDALTSDDGEAFDAVAGLVDGLLCGLSHRAAEAEQLATYPAPWDREAVYSAGEALWRQLDPGAPR
jgi:hypothetical protein